jgi:uncharacterized RDD family membrane protein YckC
MKTISINTTQNVVIEYELGALRDRIFAYFIDILILIFGGSTLIGLMSWILPYGAKDWVGYLGVFVFFFYTLAMEYFMNGQTFGKKALRLKVVKISGEEAGLTDYVTRWAFRMVDIYFSLGSVASILIGSSAKSQRIGDMAANTAVVYIRPSRDVSVKQIVTSYNTDNYKITYPDVKMFSDYEMLVLKSVLERCDKYNNEAHEDALIDAANIIKERLGLEGRLYDSRKFLKTVLNDYIVVTR